MLQGTKTFYDQYGTPITGAQKLAKTNNKPIKTKAMGLFGNIWNYNNAGKYQNRYYTLSDTEQGLDSLSRENLVRWSREMKAQSPLIAAAHRVMANFVVGSAYKPEYTGNNASKGKIYTDYLVQEVFPNFCTRGFDLNSAMKVLVDSILTDGDILSINGRNEFGATKFQYIPSHRIRSNGTNFNAPQTLSYSNAVPNTVIADGVVQQLNGRVVGYNVVDYNNLVDRTSGPQLVDKFISVNSSQLLFLPRYMDKQRGNPACAAGILQILSIQELDQYLMDKIKIESMVGLIEKNSNGEAPDEFANTLAALERQQGQNGQAMSPNTHAISIVQGPEIRYVRSDGGDIKTLASSTPGDQTANYMTRLETQVLACMGIPYQLIFGGVTGKISLAMEQTFNASIDELQLMLDKHVKFIISYSLASAIKDGLIPPSDDERLDQIFELTHPEDFSLNVQYERSADLNDVAAGVKTYGDICKKSGRTYAQLLDEQKKEQVAFYNMANEIATETNTDKSIVIQGLRDGIKTNAPLPINSNQDSQITDVSK